MQQARFVVDSSAIVAILLREPEAEHFLSLLEQAEDVRMSVASKIESGLVLSRRFGHDMAATVDHFLQYLDVRTVPLEDAHYWEAMRAWNRYGKGRSPARLNFGDCLSYATAQLDDLPLLFKGDDFVHTDVQRVR